jgi:hypothetical protein
MLTLTPPGPALPTAYLDAAGGFGWWYADVVDEAGNGVVVIAACGLPFLPGLAGAARRGTPTAPRSRPAVNVALYERGRCTWYGLHELPAGAAPAALQEPGSTAQPAGIVERHVFGDCVVERLLVGDEARFVVTLDLALPVGRAAGRVVIAGRPRGPTEHDVHTVGTPPAAAGLAEAGLPRHAWSPQILHARGHVDLTLTRPDGRSRRVVVDGAGYHDRNGGLVPLHALGIRWWLWGRAAFADEERVVYALWPDGAGAADEVVEAFGVVVDSNGSRVVPGLRVQLVRAPTNWLGMRRVDEVVVREATGATFLRARAVHVVDEGPFYTRALWRAVRDDGRDDGRDEDGRATNGVMETVDPSRVDRPWQRPFVRMRVTPPPPQTPSLWHPLFAGDAEGRVGRLWRSLVSRSP